MKIYVPDIYQKDIFHIDYEKLKSENIKFLLFDLDNTIISYHEKECSKKVKELFSKIKKFGLKPIIFSNGMNKRVSFHAHCLDVDYVSFALKPHLFNFQKVLDKYGYRKEETAIIGDQLLTDIKGGNNFGIKTILVNPLNGTESIFTRINRLKEKKIKEKLDKNNLWNQNKYYE